MSAGRFHCWMTASVHRAVHVYTHWEEDSEWGEGGTDHAAEHTRVPGMYEGCTCLLLLLLLLSLLLLCCCCHCCYVVVIVVMLLLLSLLLLSLLFLSLLFLFLLLSSDMKLASISRTFHTFFTVTEVSYICVCESNGLSSDSGHNSLGMRLTSSPGMRPTSSLGMRLTSSLGMRPTS